MSKKLIVVFAWLIIFLLADRAPSNDSKPVLRVSTPDQIKDELFVVPCNDNDDRLLAVKSLFERMGATESEISIKNFERSKVNNLVVIKPGSTKEKIVIGAHYDKVDQGCGAIDNWTGIVTIAHIYRALKDVPLNKTLIFVAFGKEESGLIGSKAMTAAIESAELNDYCAMINVDSLGLAIPQVADNLSNAKLEKLTGKLAELLKIPYSHAAIPNADGDSSSFNRRQIPALTIHGLSNDWPNYLHSKADKEENINISSVYLGYRLSLALAYELDKQACDAYR